MRNTILFCLMLLWTTVQAQVSGTAGITPAELTIEATETGGFHRITGGNEYITTPGYPELPVITQSYVLPFDAVVTGLTTTTDNRTRIPGNYQVFPAQHPIPVSDTPPPPFAETIDSIYTKELYPGVAAEIIEDGYDLGYHVVTVRIYPVEYRPLSSEIYTRSVAFTINYTMGGAPADVARPATQTYRRAALCRETIREKVENKGDMEMVSTGVQQVEPENIELSLDTLPVDKARSAQVPISVFDRIAPDYLIITSEALKPEFQRLADWKTQKGVPTKIITTEEISRMSAGLDLPEKIRNYLKQTEKKWGSGMFVLLGGDVNVVPTRMVNNHSEVLIASDMYYATTNGTWAGIDGFISSGYNASWFLGRLPAANTVEARILTDKVLRYEKADSIPDLNYFNNHAAVVSSLDNKGPGGTWRCNYLYPTKVNGYDRHGITDPWLVTDNYDCSATNFYYELSVNAYSPPCVGLPYAKRELNKENMWQAINDSIPGKGHTHILYHMDHSNPYMMGASSEYKSLSFSATEMDGLTNRRYPQIIMSGGCRPATFNVDCIAEHYLKNPNSGGVAFIGNSHDGWYTEHVQFPRFMDVLYAPINDTIPCQYAIGRAFLKAKSSSPRLHLLGDPEMPVWTATPANLSVTANVSFVAGRSNRVTVTVSGLKKGVPAMICLQKGNESYITKQITEDGTSGFIIAPNSSGKVVVTVTAHNYLPVVKEVTIDNVMAPLSLASVELTDDGTFKSRGNGSGTADAGETITLSVALLKHNTIGISNISAELKSSSPYILLKDSIVNYSIETQGDTLYSAGKFRVTIRPDAPEIWADQQDNSGLLTLTLKSGLKQIIEKFSLNINTPEIRLRDRLDILNAEGDALLKAGDRVRFRLKLFNAGGSKASSLTATLTPHAPYITCAESDIAIGDIESKSEKECASVFEIQLSENYQTGAKLPLTVNVKDIYGHRWPLSFDLSDKKLSRIELSDISSRNEESQITLVWTPLAGLRGFNIYRETVENGISVYRKLNNFEFESNTYVDENLGEFARHRYKISKVSDTGLEGNLSEAFEAATACPLADGFPIAFDGLEYMIYSSMVAYDVNNDGVKELMTSLQHRKSLPTGYLVGVDMYGKDLFDIDNNPNTHQGIASQEQLLQCAPAIGDLDGDGRPEVVTATRLAQSAGQTPQNLLTCYSMFDDNNDGKPDILWQRKTLTSCWVSPVLADLDGDNQLEIILPGDYTGTGMQYYNRSGELQLTFNQGYYPGQPAVADLNNDGEKEIIVGNPDGVYIYQMDGTPYLNRPNPVFTRPGYYFNTSVTVCDLDGDGEKEIVTAAVSQNKREEEIADDVYIWMADGPLFAFKANGQVLPGWNGDVKTRFDVSWHNGHRTAVCDMDRDGKPEVVSIGSDFIYILNPDGTVRKKISVPKKKYMPIIGGVSPILADVDGDDEAEVVMVAGNNEDKAVWAYKLNGEQAKGFPLHSLTWHKGSPCVVDVDGDGLNELITGSLNNIYMWRTPGKASPLDWGYERGNAAFTGEYAFCKPLEIKTTTYWDSSRQVCGDIVITSGALMVRNGLLTVGADASITVRAGAELIVDGWSEVRNADIRVESGGTLTLQNGGQIHLRPGGRVYVEKGATLNNLDGALYPR